MDGEMLNEKEEALRKIYSEWQVGIKYKQDPNFSDMFCMGVPNDFLTNGKPLIMYVGQECLRGEKYKTQGWVREYQEEIMQKKKDNRCFWKFYLALSEKGYNVIWNNLNKFHNSDSRYLDEASAITLNTPYGAENLSVIQREINELKPQIIVFAVGNNKRYVKSLAAAFSVSEDTLMSCVPVKKQPVHEISKALGLENIKVFWCYHPAYLNRSKNFENVIDWIK